MINALCEKNFKFEISLIHFLQQLDQSPKLWLSLIDHRVKTSFPRESQQYKFEFPKRPTGMRIAGGQRLALPNENVPSTHRAVPFVGSVGGVNQALTQKTLASMLIIM